MSKQLCLSMPDSLLLALEQHPTRGNHASLQRMLRHIVGEWLHSNDNADTELLRVMLDVERNRLIDFGYRPGPELDEALRAYEKACQAEALRAKVAK